MSSAGAGEGTVVQRPPSPSRGYGVMLWFAAGGIWAMWVATEYVAWRCGFHPNLGLPAAVLDTAARRLCLAGVVAALTVTVALIPHAHARAWGPLSVVAAMSCGIGTLGTLYGPGRLVIWYRAFGSIEPFPTLFRGAWVVLAAAAALACSAVLTLSRSARVRPRSTAFGSAMWDSGEQLREGQGLILGRDAEGQLLRYAGEGHLITLAPTGSGKGVSCVLPNLVNYPGSIVVVDLKGENAAVSARWRHVALGQKVVVLDPFGVVPESDHVQRASFNPLDLIDETSIDAIDDARLLADMVVQVDGGRNARETHWNVEARALLSGLSLCVATYGRRTVERPPGTESAEPGSELSAKLKGRSLTEVRSILTQPAKQLEEFMQLMLQSEAKVTGPLIRRAAARLLQKAAEERSGVISTAQSHTHFLDSPRMATCLGTSTVNFADVKRGGHSVYLVLPPDRLDGYSRWVRLMIGALLIALTREHRRSRSRVVVMIDEFQNLGRVGEVERHVALVRGYGVQFWLFCQDLSMIKARYEEAWGTFLANADVLQAFGVNDLETSEHLSRLTGESTIAIETENVSRGVSHGRQHQRSEGAARTLAERGRRLLFADEVRRLGRAEQLLFVKGTAPIRCRRVDYRCDPEFAGRFDQNPMYDAEPPARQPRDRRRGHRQEARE